MPMATGVPMTMAMSAAQMLPNSSGPTYSQKLVQLPFW